MQSPSGQYNNRPNDHFLSVIVPLYGEMGAMLMPIFCSYMQTFLDAQLGPDSYEIVFSSQQDKLMLNKGYGINIAVSNADPAADYFVIHDVDLFPFWQTNYSYAADVTKLTRNLCNYLEFRKCILNIWDFSLGGAILIPRSTFEAVNGMSNSFWGWGGEDDELFCRITQEGFNITYDYNSYQWHVEGLRPDAHKKETSTPEYRQNVQLITLCRNSKANKYNDGLKQAQSHIAVVTRD